ncbi:MAG TPA: hypothetical protein VMB50_05555 [Myxococcales bacterium]|nr:hypothetical protein [Myxococcales bacterium]
MAPAAAPATQSSKLRVALDSALESFRSQDRYFKLQAALVAAWLAVSLATVVGVAWTSSSGDRLGADVRAEMAVGGPVLLITNNSSSRWTDVTYTLNDAYVYRQAALEAGDHLTVPVGRFRKGGSGGRRAPRDTEPKALTIACEEGQTRVVLGKGKGP